MLGSFQSIREFKFYPFTFLLYDYIFQLQNKHERFVYFCNGSTLLSSLQFMVFVGDFNPDHGSTETVIQDWNIVSFVLSLLYSWADVKPKVFPFIGYWSVLCSSSIRGLPFYFFQFVSRCHSRCSGQDMPRDTVWLLSLNRATVQSVAFSKKRSIFGDS